MSKLVSDPAIAEKYEEVRSDKCETNWLALQYTPNTKPDALHVSATGTGGLSEFTSTLPTDDAVFGFVRINIGNDEYSQRSKFVFVRWCGPETKVMRKAKLGIHSGEVTSVIRTYAVEIQTDEKRDLEEERVMTLVRKAMGANYDRQSTAY